MKTIILNGSPRKNWNTAQLLKSAREGAVAAGAETEYINLYDLVFTGCRSCLACKRKDTADPCKCYWQDDLSPVLESILSADRLIIGSPIYYGEPTAAVRALLERLVFPAMSYNTYSGIYNGSLDIDVFLTMNVGEEDYREEYQEKMEEYFEPMTFLNGSVRITPVCDTLQVEDYSKYEMAGFSEAHKRSVHEEQFPQALKKAYEIGAGKIE